MCALFGTTIFFVFFFFFGTTTAQPRPEEAAVDDPVNHQQRLNKIRRRELQGCAAAPTALPVHIISDYSKLVLRANPDGTVVQAFGSSRNDDNWVFVAAGSGLYRVVVQGTNKAMSIVGGAAEDGVAVEVTTSASTDGRDVWCLRTVANTNGSYLLENFETKKLIDVAGFSQLNGAKIHQWTNVGGTNQRWTFSLETNLDYVPTWECIGFSTNLSYKIVAKHSNKALAVAGSTPFQGASIQQSSVLVVNQWKLVSATNGFYHITEQRSGLAMKVVGGTQDGASVLLSTPTQGFDDDWCFIPLGNSFYEIRNRETGKSIDISGISIADGALVHQWGYVGGDNQKFSMLAPTTPQAPKAPTSSPIVAQGSPLALSTWQGPIKTPAIAAAAASLPDGRIVLWAAKSRTHFVGSEGAQTWSAIYDPSTGSLTEEVVLTNHDMFCPGTSLLSNGVLMVSGGSSSSETTFFDYRINKWSVGPKLNIARGYHTHTVLATGEVFTVGGSWSGGGSRRDGEIWNPRTNVWRTLSNVPSLPLQTADREGTYRSDNHYWLFLAPNGKVFHAGPRKQMHWLTTLDNGSIEVSIQRGDDTDAMNGNAVMYDVGKILTLGGAPNYGTGVTSNRAYVIDVTSTAGAVVVQRSGNMNFARALGNSVVLPNGEVVVIGGQTFVELFSDNNAVLEAEIWNPVTGRFTTLVQKMRIPRTYHSVALLMKDGRVWTAGGGLCGDCIANHQDYEILTPPYLFRPDGTLATRPLIVTSPKQTKAGEIIKVTVDTIGAHSFSLVRTSAVTHSVNNDQRRIPLSIITNINREYLLGIPINKNVALTGVYYLFAMNKDGVPSVGKDIEILIS